MRLAILTGAGASYGAGEINPHAPPLGAAVYSKLQTAWPATWGSLPSALAACFEEDFEKGMFELWKSPGSHSALLWEMGLYFAGFAPDARTQTCYDRLLTLLVNNSLLAECAFATLNYECVLDAAALRCGLRPLYFGSRTASRDLPIWKLHGACNLLPDAKIFHVELDISELAAKADDLTELPGLFDGPVRAVHPSELPAERARGSLPPAMSLFAPGKPTPICGSFVEATRREWHTWLEETDVVLVVGARPLLADYHVWIPIISSPAAVWYIGHSEDIPPDLSDKLGSRLRQIAGQFDEAFEDLQGQLDILHERHRQDERSSAESSESNAGSLISTYRDEVLSVAELAGFSGEIRDLSFVDCVLRGPAVIWLDGGSNIDPVFPATDIEDLLWEVPQAQRTITGAILVKDCSFTNCRFEKIGLAGRSDFLDSVRSSAQPAD